MRCHRPAQAIAEARRFSVKNAKGEAAALPNFWLATNAPSAVAGARVKPPKRKTVCPMSGRRLRVRDLIAVHFTPLVTAAATTAAVGAPAEQYMCPVTRAVISNQVKVAVLRPSGRVVSMACVERLVQPSMTDPISGESLTAADIIPIRNDGTGYAGSGAALDKAKVSSSQMVG